MALFKSWISLILKLIEETTQMTLEDASYDLIFTPLNVTDVKVVLEKGALKECKHVKEGYEPRWLYHGMIIGSLRSACLLLHGLSTGNLIGQNSFDIMQETYDLKFDIGNRPWKKPSYAHGLMIIILVILIWDLRVLFQFIII
ncbi:MAG: hypothetical protein JEZ08_00685 [Clostridiales bacterium]|nr:hypothetical protein [Clostridiales bacterium]